MYRFAFFAPCAVIQCSPIIYLERVDVRCFEAASEESMESGTNPEDSINVDK